MGPNYQAFGKFLLECKSRIKTPLKDLKKKLRTNNIGHWYRGDTLPGKKMLPSIAKVFKADPEELRTAYKSAKEAREAEKKFRKAPKVTPCVSSFQPEDYGTISGTKNLAHSNLQVHRDKSSRYR